MLPPPVLLLAACAKSPEIVGDAEAHVSERVATVLHVTVSTRHDAEVYVEFGEDTSYGQRSATSIGTDHDVPLVGMPSDTPVHWRAVIDGEPQGDHTTSTDLLPPELPALTTTVDEATWPGFLVMTLLGTWEGPVVLDRHGRIVWYAFAEDNLTSAIRAHPSVDGDGVVYNTIVSEAVPTGTINFLDWDGELRRKVELEAHSHDFVQLDDGTLVAIRISKQQVGSELVVGDAVVTVSPDGTEAELWNAFDWFDPITTGTDRVDGWTHANALGYDAEAGVIQVGIRNLETIVSIDPQSGELLDAFGGEVNDGWTFADAPRPFSYQHQFQLTQDRALVFDNGYASYDDSRVVEYALDADTRTATQVWEYHFEPNQWLIALGDVDRLDDGSTLIAWDLGGRLEQVDADGELIWQVEADVGSAFGYIHRVDALR